MKRQIAVMPQKETNSSSLSISANARIQQTLRGIIPPLITPLRDRDTLDVAGLERLIEHILAGGVHGVFVLGTTGEAPSLSYRLRRQVIEVTCRRVAGRVPVLVGVTDTAFVESVNLARFAAEAGADAVVASAPYYFPAGQPELLEYFRRLIRELPVPLVLYNIPTLTKIQFEHETVAQLLASEKVLGIKDSSGSLPYLRKILKVASAHPDRSVLVGAEDLLVEGLAAGAHGGVVGGALIDPRLYVELYGACRERKRKQIRELRSRMRQLGRIYKVGQNASGPVKGIKCALSLLGICDDHMAEPLSRLGPEAREQVRLVLESLGLYQGQFGHAHAAEVAKC
ncbi:MAG: dihydrodipicolinate synthase family protein [Verrucomicrobiae bacterium]|nr:dihydrodipicolinate synthase family protein [Verrucomicrobiae bacterium]